MHKHHVTIKMSLKTFIKNLVSFRKLSLRQNAVQISHVRRGSCFLKIRKGLAEHPLALSSFPQYIRPGVSWRACPLSCPQQGLHLQLVTLIPCTSL